MIELASESWDRLCRWLRRAAWGSCILAIAVWFTTVALRWSYALDLEWMESGALDQAARIVAGDLAYPAPSARFVPHLYTPGYSWLLAQLGRWGGLDFGLARALSIFWSLVSMAALWRITQREGKEPLHGAIAVAIFAAGYVFTFRWMDLARADAQFVALTLWALAALRDAWGDWKKALLAGVLISAAYWTKQTAFVLIIGSGVAALWTCPKQLPIYAATIAMLCGLGTFVYNISTDGYFWHYIFELHQQHAFNWARFRHKTWMMGLHAWPFAAAMLAAWFIQVSAPWWSRQRRLDRAQDTRLRARLIAYRGTAYWGTMAGAGWIASATSYSTQWAEANAFLPGLALTAAFIGVALPKLRDRRSATYLVLISLQIVFSTWIEPSYFTVQKNGWGEVLKSYTWGATFRGIPSSVERERARKLRNNIESLATSGWEDSWGYVHQGPLLALQHPWWSRLSGSEGHVASMAFQDLPIKDAEAIQRQIYDELQSVKYAAVWVDGRVPTWLARGLTQHYRLMERKTGSQRVLPMSGWMSEAGTLEPYRGAQRLYVPVAAVVVPTGCRAVVNFEDATLQGVRTQGDAFSDSPARTGEPRRGEWTRVGGHFYLSSESRRRGRSAMGSARLSLSVRAGESRLVLSRGWAGAHQKDVSVALVGRNQEAREIALPKRSGVLERTELSISDHGGPWELVVRDASETAAIAIDELWICAN